jgi:hypothetical protein
MESKKSKPSDRSTEECENRSQGRLCSFMDDEEGSMVYSSLDNKISKYESRFDRKQFIAWLKGNGVACHIATLEECERLMAEIRRRVGGFSPRCAQRIMVFYRAAEDKIAVRAVTSALRKMRTELTNDCLQIYKEEIR